MSIETRTAGIYTEYVVWPPGFSQFATDLGTEVVTKANPATAFAAGQVVVAGAVTSAGETWRAEAGGEINAPEYRHGRVVSASASGVPTMTIVRFQRSLLDTSTSSKLVNGSGNDAAGTVDPLGRVAGTWGDHQQVLKPSAETWTTQGAIYAYLSGTTTLYTNVLATAAAAAVCWVAGANGMSVGAGSTEGWIVQPRLGEPGRVTYPSDDGLGEELVSFAFPFPPSLFGSIQSDASRSTYATSFSATTPTVLGTVVGVDKTTSPPTYRVLRDGYTRGMDQQGIDTIFARVGKALAIANTAGANVTLEQVNTGFGTAVRVLAPNILPGLRSTGGSAALSALPVDLALDVDLPAPIGNARIVWLACKGSPLMTPILVQRTTSSAPAASMAATGTSRPKALGSPNDNGSQQQATYLRGWNHAYPLARAMDIGGGPVRVYQLPSLYCYNGSSGDTVDWRWVRFDHSTGAWTNLSAYAAATWTGTRWEASAGTPPGFTADQSARISMQFRINGTAYVLGVGVTPVSLFSSEKSASVNALLAHYPYDVQTWHGPSHADCRWTGHYGWHFTEQLTLPAITWGTCTIAYTAGKLVVNVGVQPSVAATARVSNIENQTLWNRPRLRVHDPIRGVGIAYSAGLPFNTTCLYREDIGLAVLEFTSQPTSITLYNPQGAIAASQVEVEAYQLYRVDSDYGPVTFARQAGASAVTIP